MEYILLVWPHANVRYQKESERLALHELVCMLRRTQQDVQCAPAEKFFLPAISIRTETPLNAKSLTAISLHSLLYGLFRRDGDALYPLLGRKGAYLGEDLPGILKYKGKTNELFTAMTLNMALYSGAFAANVQEKLHIFDPMCGKATALFVAANRGYDTTGMDTDKNELNEAEKFFKRYLEYNKFKHTLRQKSLTIQGGKSAPVACFRYADAPDAFVESDAPCLQLVTGDCRDARRALGKEKFHAIVCDLPYGVQHAPHGGSIQQLLENALPAWRETLKSGGTCAISYNIDTLPRKTIQRIMENSGFAVLTGEAYDHLTHWVEQAVTRDVIVGIKEKQ